MAFAESGGNTMKSEPALPVGPSKHLIGGAGRGGRYHPLLKRPLLLARGKGSASGMWTAREYIDFFTGSGGQLSGPWPPRPSARRSRDALDVGSSATARQSITPNWPPWCRPPCRVRRRFRFANSGTRPPWVAIRNRARLCQETENPEIRGPLPRRARLPWWNCSGRGRRYPRGRDGRAPLPDSDGMPDPWPTSSWSFRSNDLDAFERAVAAHRHELAAVIIEPSRTHGLHPRRSRLFSRGAGGSAPSRTSS